jgi:hypothetical protein
MNETKSIKVQQGSVTTEGRVEISQNPPWTLAFSGLGLGDMQFSGSDLFEALIELRRELERLGAKPLCAGARMDVFPSAMSRSMAGGRKAYVTRLGFQARRGDIIDIFDDAAPDLVASVTEQNAFHEKWFESLGK